MGKELMEKEPMRIAASAPFAPALAPFQRWLLFSALYQ